ncbi:hypothetical protein DMB66_09830 [Actinoplanes sp. ATCC 53533]|uniref:hypothetical protein n=1 Tax=Actinoplanes sp. ATCC 53533 TaxID=1288362 RepID=UPI000F788C7C|nr:hypothetical protein [Actinoplanes sp. ATCC 53533]RSM70081.1 hypothetical protein DMB66_09830 [Actinoplanes sp. ATCC 53533]
MPKPVDLSSPASRREALRMVDVGDPRPHHAMLREIFDLERTWREGRDSGESDEYEQIYVTAFLLFLIGDPADSPRLYAAKFRTGDMDLGIGFDAQAIFGAGRHGTLRWLSENGYTDERAHLSEWLSQAEDPKIEDWARQVRDYFYSPNGVLLLDEL